MNLIRRLLPTNRRSTNAPSIPPGERVYAIGDIHGRLDLFDALMAQVDADNAVRASARTHLILLGDLIDRGPQSAQVMQRALDLQTQRPDVHILFGNHEDMMLSALRSDRNEAIRMFVRNGGEETFLSYGIDEQSYAEASFEDLREMAFRHIPAAHIELLETMEQSVAIGDYLFVHAGVKPGVPLSDQRPSDLRWIRDEFLSSRVDHGAMIVHGHSITPAVEERANRIGIDTGAYASNILTAIALEGTDRWFIDTSETA